MSSIVTRTDIRTMNKRGRIAIYFIVVLAWQVIGWLAYPHLPDTKQIVMDLSIWAVSFMMVWFILCYQLFSQSLWVSWLIALYAIVLTVISCDIWWILLDRLHPAFLHIVRSNVLDTIYRVLNQIGFTTLFLIMPIVFCHVVGYLMTGFQRKPKAE